MRGFQFQYPLMCVLHLLWYDNRYAAFKHMFIFISRHVIVIFQQYFNHQFIYIHQAHSLRVMQTVDKCVNRLDHADKMASILVQLGHRHISYMANFHLIPVSLQGHLEILILFRHVINITEKPITVNLVHFRSAQCVELQAIELILRNW